MTCPYINFPEIFSKYKFPKMRFFLMIANYMPILI
jgi:hypothetical protein